MDNVSFSALMFPLLFFFIFLGVPVAFSLITTAFIGGWMVFGPLAANQIFGIIQHTATQFILTAIPAFVFMGVVLESSGISARLFQAMHVWLGRLPGGIALTTMSMAGIVAASTGIVGAVEIVIGIMAIPIMLSQNYSKSLISGTICAGGSLGTMVPPSIVIVIYASISNQSVGRLFWAVVIPATIMVFLFCAYIFLSALFWPETAPRDKNTETVPLREKLRLTATGIFPAMALIVAVLGSILWGIATPTEAASIGSVGAIILSMMYRTLTWTVVKDAFVKTIFINSMIMLIVVGGNAFSGIFRLHKGNELIQAIVDSLSVTPSGVVLILLIIVFVAGLVLDWVSIVLITLPIFMPLLTTAKVEPIWFATLMIIVIQTSYLTPPMAPSIFYLRSISPPSITYRDMYLGVVPFIICQIVVLLIVWFFPLAATYLPTTFMGQN